MWSVDGEDNTLTKKEDGGDESEVQVVCSMVPKKEQEWIKRNKRNKNHGGEARLRLSSIPRLDRLDGLVVGLDVDVECLGPGRKRQQIAF
jgi:hypothetical protein